MSNQPRHRHRRRGGADDLRRRHGLLRAFGRDPNGYALLQPNLSYFDQGDGFVAYRRALLGTLVPGDPVAPPSQQTCLVERFLESTCQASFFYVTGELVQRLHDSVPGYRVAPLATEPVLDLDAADLADAKQVQGALKQARRAGLQVTRFTPGELTPDLLDALHQVNRDFLARSRAGREISFISRPVELVDLPDVRFYRIATRAESVLGFLVLDPYYRDGALVGFQLNAIRFRRTKIWGVFLSVVATLARQLAEEGHGVLALGGLPFDDLDAPSPFPHDRALSATVRFVRDNVDRLHNLSGFKQMKLAFGGRKIRRYAAVPRWSAPPLEILRYARACGLF